MTEHDNGAVLDYLATLGRMEPDIAPVDTIASLASIAISMNRIATALEVMNSRIADPYTVSPDANAIATAISAHSTRVVIAK